MPRQNTNQVNPQLLDKKDAALAPTAGILSPVVIVAALGYFVDIYDLLLFGIVRVQSLTDIGLKGDELTTYGTLLLDMQMVGMLLGGILWGILGDKKGRLSVLFASIITYSLANLLNGMVTDIYSYAALRFVAGIGLAGELGIGITLVSEVLPKEKRGYAVTLVASIGIAGAVFAGFLADQFHWRTCYYIGGGMGLALLALRVGVRESSMFAKVESSAHVVKGDFLALFKKRKTFIKYLRSILVGLPVWFVIGILIIFSPELARELGVQGEVKPSQAIMYGYAGLMLGDVVSGLLSQWIKSRKKVLYLFWGICVASCTLYFSLRGLSITGFYTMCALVGFSVGYWVIFMAVAAEQFGTNLRATVTTTVPNFIRGAVVPISLGFLFFSNVLESKLGGAITIGAICLGLGLWATFGIKETFGKDLDFIED